MKRLHVHVSVEDLTAARAFYSALFDQEPAVDKPDYAKWEVNDPPVNLAVSHRPGHATGVNHLGIQASSEQELAGLRERLGKADIGSQPETDAHCCYARGEKEWTADPAGVVWEMFHTMGTARTYGEDRSPDVGAVEQAGPTATSCC